MEFIYVNKVLLIVGYQISSTRDQIKFKLNNKVDFI